MLPPTLHNLTTDAAKKIAARVKESFFAEARRMKIDSNLEQNLVDIYVPLAATLRQVAQRQDAPLIVGINGAQGAGKSTLCRLLQIVLEQGFDQKVVSISIDDLYLTHAERCQLAEQKHPLLATRGVPGTHDVSLGLRLLSNFRHRQTIQMPVFDKATDDRRQQKDWRQVTGPFDLVLFEGWCVGARAETEETLAVPINILEREEDPDVSWRRYVNQKLNGDYRQLFAEIDFLVMLKVPDMESVMQWRGLQERKLALASGQQKEDKIMDAAALQRFIMHYERLTRNMLNEMPDRADLVLELSPEHQIDGVRINTPTPTGEV
jgi:D-glycerate 3-kinase